MSIDTLLEKMGLESGKKKRLVFVNSSFLGQYLVSIANEMTNTFSEKFHNIFILFLFCLEFSIS